MTPVIHCKYDELVNPSELKDYEKNPNKHADDQIERLAKLYEYHGIRHPIIICKDRGVIAAGHGRKLAAIKAGIDAFPVVYQKFETEEQFYSFIVSDNAIAEWSELDISKITKEITNFGSNFDFDFLGIKDFEIPDFEPATAEEQGQLDQKKLIFVECPHCGEQFEQSQARKIEN